MNEAMNETSISFHREFGGHTIHAVRDAAPGGYDRTALCGKRTVLLGGPAPYAGMCRKCEAALKPPRAEVVEASLFEGDEKTP